MTNRITPANIDKVLVPHREIYITDGFEFFDNRIYLNELIERCFPSDAHINMLNWYITKPIPVVFLEQEKARLKKEYPPLSLRRWKNASQYGYMCRSKGGDFSIEDIEVDFIEWKRDNKDLWLNNFKRDYPNLVMKDIGKLFEFKFFEQIAQGYNDAIYEDYLANYFEEDVNRIKTKDHTFESIFEKASYHQVYKELLYELEIVDKVTDKSLIRPSPNGKTAKAYLVSAVIVSLKKSSKKLIKRNYSYDDLLTVFNNHLNISMKQVKLQGPRFKWAYKEIREFTKSKIK